jgi:hypothetical protein
VVISVNEIKTCRSEDRRYIRRKDDPESKEPAGRRRYGRAAGEEMNFEISLRFVGELD